MSIEIKKISCDEVNDAMDEGPVTIVVKGSASIPGDVGEEKIYNDRDKFLDYCIDKLKQGLIISNVFPDIHNIKYDNENNVTTFDLKMAFSLFDVEGIRSMIQSAIEEGYNKAISDLMKDVMDAKEQGHAGQMLLAGLRDDSRGN